ncbi:MAG TPA: DUF2889 domain-containing protein [Myxococcota bacterium]|nr:DUF2889 domain-containing protein [Myxococcota bacterium]
MSGGWIDDAGAARAASRAVHPRHGIHAPTRGTLARAPRSLRRTATTDMLRPDGLHGELVLVGRARDLWTDDRGDGRVLGEAGYEARVEFEAMRTLRELRTTPERVAAQKLLGARVTTGFRSQLDAALPGERDARSLLYLLLDDAPVATLVSGYAMGAGGVRHRAKPGQMLQHPDLCAGWRSGGTMLVGLAENGFVPTGTGPEAPPILRDGDPAAWHALAPLSAHGMRRHRRLDLVRIGEELVVDGFLRDLHVAADGFASIVHEYTVSAAVDARSFTFARITAEARVLPWVECNPAHASAARLAGQRVGDLRARVRTDFTGVTTCTHLNDTLRSLEDIERLAGVLARESARGS